MSRQLTILLLYLAGSLCFALGTLLAIASEVRK